MKYISNVVTLEYDAARCTGCGRCVEVCPRGVFAISERKVTVVRRDQCIECGACSGNCAFDALTVQSGVGCAAAMIDGLLRTGDPDKGCCDGSSGCC
jgi:NAD-dependent dihydropyrimidine dehydrogenase PreA subunit